MSFDVKIRPGMSGAFITFEGIEGSGKTTQAKLLKGYLESKGLEVVLTREPGGTELSERIRQLLADPSLPIRPEAELMLFMASRAQHVRELIRPALERGATVICDRFADSSAAYQGYGRGIDLELISALNEFATGGLKPDLTILLDLDPEEGLRRARRGRGDLDRIELEELEFHRRVREGYLEMARREPDRFVVIRADVDIDSVHRRVREAVERCLGM